MHLKSTIYQTTHLYVVDTWRVHSTKWLIFLSPFIYGGYHNLVPRVLSYPPSLSLRRAGRREPWERGCDYYKHAPSKGFSSVQTCALVDVVCYTAVFRVVTQCSSLRDDTKNGCVADYGGCQSTVKDNREHHTRKCLWTKEKGKSVYDNWARGSSNTSSSCRKQVNLRSCWVDCGFKCVFTLHFAYYLIDGTREYKPHLSPQTVRNSFEYQVMCLNGTIHTNTPTIKRQH